jgi:hypothetical protein
MKSYNLTQPSKAHTGSKGPLATTAVLALAALLAMPEAALANHRSLSSPATNWTRGPFYGKYGTFFADVDGDGKADAIAAKADRVWWRRSNGCAFESSRPLTHTPFFGTLGTYFADVTGDNKVDPIANNSNGVIVRRSEDGRRVRAIDGPLNKNVTFADIDGDGRADAVEMEPQGIIVRFSSSDARFTNPVNSTPPSRPAQYGTHGTYFADVNGDKRADAIFVNDWGISVRQTSPNDPLPYFYPADAWTADAYYGQIMNAFVDMTGDGYADAVAVNYDGIAVRDSLRFGFRGLNANNEVTSGDFAIRPWGYWTLDGFYGTRQTSFADVDGDGAADAIAVNADGVWIRRSHFTDFVGRC